jgi:uncharacterized protein YkwD
VLAAHAAPVGAEDCPGADLMPTAADRPAVQAATLCLVNQERTSRGRAALRSQSQLAGVATVYSAQMVREGFFSHVSPEGDTLQDRVRATGYMRPAGVWALGENLAYATGDLATPRVVVSAWMHSAEHRANILQAQFDRVGVGVAPGYPYGDQDGATYALELGTRTLSRVAQR